MEKIGGLGNNFSSCGKNVRCGGEHFSGDVLVIISVVVAKHFSCNGNNLNYDESSFNCNGNNFNCF